jgi:hypothetical protein
MAVVERSRKRQAPRLGQGQKVLVAVCAWEEATPATNAKGPERWEGRRDVNLHRVYGRGASRADKKHASARGGL